MEKTIKVETIHCGGCERRAKNAVEALPEVESAAASKDTQTVVVTLRSAVDDSALKAALEGADFRVIEIK